MLGGGPRSSTCARRDGQGRAPRACSTRRSARSTRSAAGRASSRGHGAPRRLNPHELPRKKRPRRPVPRGVVGVIAPWNFPVAGLYRPPPGAPHRQRRRREASEYTPRTSAWLVERLAAELPEGLGQVAPRRRADGRRAHRRGDRRLRLHRARRRPGARSGCSAPSAGSPPASRWAARTPPSSWPTATSPRTVAGHALGARATPARPAAPSRWPTSTSASPTPSSSGCRSAGRASASGTRRADVAPLANRRQLDIVVAQVEDARAKGAVVVCGGRRPGEGLCYPPTVLDAARPMKVVRGTRPSAPCSPSSASRARPKPSARVNDARYGLGRPSGPATSPAPSAWPSVSMSAS